jgi:carboxymethylenebutenolidase
MCYDLDSSPPMLAGPGAVGASDRLELASSDGTRFDAFRAKPAGPARASVLVLPDVRGLVPYYVDLTCRFAEHGFEALAIDYFGRTAPPARDRPADYEYHPHADAATFAGLGADVRAAVDHLRATSDDPDRPLFSIGFCFGGRLSFLTTTLGLGLAGAIGLHAGLVPRNDLPAPADRATDMAAPVLGLFGGADPSIPPEAVAGFDEALRNAGVAHRFVTYPGAPHSFFDRKWEQFAAASAAAWDEVLEFIRDPTAATAG